MGRLWSGPRLVGQIGSGVWISASFQGSLRVRTPPRGRQGRCSPYPHPNRTNSLVHSIIAPDKDFDRMLAGRPYHTDGSC